MQASVYSVILCLEGLNKGLVPGRRRSLPVRFIFLVLGSDLRRLVRAMGLFPFTCQNPSDSLFLVFELYEFIF